MPFQPGNTLGAMSKGRKQAALLREAALATASPQMAGRAMKKLYEIGMDGDVKALCEWLNRIGVRPILGDDEDSLASVANKIIEIVYGADPRVKALEDIETRGNGGSLN